MEIVVSKYAGFCEGVDRAYRIVEKIAQDPNVKKPIMVLGSLVHNEDVVAKIEKLGVKKLELGEKLEEALENIKGKLGTLVITAHGMGPQIYSLAKKLGIDLVDTTCPRVIKVQRLAKAFLDKDAQIVIVGERNHKEVRGINEWAERRAVFVETPEDLCGFVLDSARKIVVLSQTTQDQEFVAWAGAEIVKRYPKAQLMDSICLTTHHRQTEVKEMAKKNDAVVVIGSPDSANSNRLWEIARKTNARSYFVSGAKELEQEWFANCHKVGVSAGASTPDWIIAAVLRKLKGYGRKRK